MTRKGKYAYGKVDTKLHPRFKVGDIVEVCDNAISDKFSKNFVILPARCVIHKVNLTGDRPEYTLEGINQKRMNRVKLLSHEMRHKAPEKAIFREYRNGSIIVLFPLVFGTNDPATCQSYMYNGQHASACVWGENSVINNTERCTDAKKIDDMIQHLRIRYGYVIEQIQKSTRNHYNWRAEQIRIIESTT